MAHQEPSEAAAVPPLAVEPAGARTPALAYAVAAAQRAVRLNSRSAALLARADALLASSARRLSP